MLLIHELCNTVMLKIIGVIIVYTGGGVCFYGSWEIVCLCMVCFFH